MNLYVILRRNGWPTPDELQAGARRSIEEGERRTDRVRWIRSYVLAEQAGASARSASTRPSRPTPCVSTPRLARYGRPAL